MLFGAISAAVTAGLTDGSAAKLYVNPKPAPGAADVPAL